MKLRAALCFLLFVGCATAQSTQALHLSQGEEGGGGPAGNPSEYAHPVRMEMPAGTFLVSPGHAEEFKKALAGEVTPTRFYAGADR